MSMPLPAWLLIIADVFAKALLNKCELYAYSWLSHHHCLYTCLACFIKASCHFNLFRTIERGSIGAVRLSRIHKV